MALQLHRRGIVRVRPLLGGLDAWRERRYPLQSRVTATAAAGSAAQLFSAEG